jgi:hypothetical protein
MFLLLAQKSERFWSHNRIFGPDGSQLTPTSESTTLPETSFRIGSDYYLSNRGCFRYRAPIL